MKFENQVRAIRLKTCLGLVQDSMQHWVCVKEMKRRCLLRVEEEAAAAQDLKGKASGPCGYRIVER
jgi:hypothetical protein